MSRWLQVVIVATVLLAVLALVVILRPAPPPPAPPARMLVRTTPAPAPIDPFRPAVSGAPLPQIPPGERSHLADELNAPGGTGTDDLRIVKTLFNGYRERFGGYPVGEDNTAFMTALMGHNPLGLAFLPGDHPAVDRQGRLLDRWGEPYFVHLLDRNAIELRSAGPDRRMYTEDDLLLR